MDEVEELLYVLDLAFGDLRVPPENGLVIDSSGSDLESNEVRVKFSRRHWKELAIDDLVGESDALAFFTPEAFRFFLPAFIRVAVLDWERADQIPDSILWSLVRPDIDKWWRERQDSLQQTAQRLNFSKELMQELAPKEELGLDVYMKRRLAVLSEEQKYAVRKFISFLRTHHSEEFRFGELDLVEKSLGFCLP